MLKPQVLTEKEIQESVPLKGDAKFFQGDNPAFSSPDFDDSSWMYMNFNVKESFKKYQTYWIRYYFTIDSASVNKPLCFRISQMGASEIFFNGKKIETVGKGDLDMYFVKQLNNY